MNKEIKDLIEQLGVCSVNDYNFEIYGNEAKILNKYISNLQSENKQLKEAIKRCCTQEEVDFEIMPVKAELEAEKDSNNNLHKTIDKLRVNLYEIQQENQQLKEENSRLKIKCRKIKKELKEEIKVLELIIGSRQKRSLIHKFDKEYDEEDKRKNPNRDYAGIMPDAEEVYKRYYKQQEIINKAIEYIKGFEDIKAYYSYEENGYEEYNYDEDFKIELLEILKGGD